MPTWQPSSNGLAASTTEDVRMGTNRATMQTNALLTRAELGKVKKIQFNAPADEHVFGYTGAKDPEGAREVTMIWKAHQATVAPGVKAGQEDKPTPDFKTMNKLAVISGVSNARQLPAFRENHLVTVKAHDGSPPTAASRQSGPPAGPPGATYGMSSAYRSADVVRNCGADEPPMKHVVQGAYQDDWIRSNVVREAQRVERPYIPPVATRATMGHTLGAQKYLAPECHDEAWKMTKFKAEPPRVTAHMGGPTGVSMRPGRDGGSGGGGSGDYAPDGYGGADESPPC